MRDDKLAMDALAAERDAATERAEKAEAKLRRSDVITRELLSRTSPEEARRILAILDAALSGPPAPAVSCSPDCECGTYRHTAPVEIRDRVVHVDACIADIVSALNVAGMETVASCCGHGRMDGRIDLADGRVLSVSPAAAPAVSQAAADVLAERRRQIEVEGRTPEHDDEHSRGEMASAAACYALASNTVDPNTSMTVHLCWPWGRERFKFDSPRRNLVKAGALILAEIERLDCAAQAEREG